MFETGLPQHYELWCLGGSAMVPNYKRPSGHSRWSAYATKCGPCTLYLSFYSQCWPCHASSSPSKIVLSLHLLAEPVKDCTAEQTTATLLVLEPGAFIAAEDYRKLATAVQVRFPHVIAPSLKTLEQTTRSERV